MGLTPSTVRHENPISGDKEESNIMGEMTSIKLGHTWTIGSIYHLCKVMKTKDSIVSPIFFSGVNKMHQWRLILYPCGDKVGTSLGEISLYLELVSKPNSSNLDLKLANITLSIINNAGNEIKPRVNLYNLMRSCSLYKTKTMWGYSRFISHNELFSSKPDNPYIENFDAPLTIFCGCTDFESAFVIPAKSNRVQLYATNSIRKLLSDFEVLLHNSDSTDVTIETATQSFLAHKIILSARSPVFAAAFTHDMREKSENILVIEDVRAEIMTELLMFIYTGRVTDLKGNAMELLVVANKYALDELKLKCEETLFNSLTIDTAIDLLVFTDVHKAAELKIRITQFIIANSKGVAKSKNFEAAVKSHPQLIAEIFQKMALN